MNQAIKPSFLNMNILKDIKPVNVTPSEEDAALQSLSEHTGWKVLSAFIKELIEEMDTVQAQAIMSGLPREEIGENAIVMNMVKTIVSRILHKVSDAKEIIEKINE